MKKIDIKKIYDNYKDFNQQHVKVAGWVRSVRDLKNFAFITLNDGTCFKCVQIVINKDIENYSVLSKLNAGSSLICNGVVTLLENNEKQPFCTYRSFEIGENHGFDHS